MKNHPIHWLYLQTGNTLLPGSERCYLCGSDCDTSSSITKCIAETFNSHYLAQCRSSAYLCAACAWYLDSKAGHADFRKMSLLVSRRNWQNWQRQDMKMEIDLWLRHGLEDEAYLVVSLSKKKHILLQAPYNARGSRRLAIQVEERVAHVDLSAWTQIERPFMALLALGHHKGEILSGDLSATTLRKHGRLMEAMHLSKQLDAWRNSPLIELYSYATILEEKGQSEDEGLRRRDIAERGDAANRFGLATLAGSLEEHRSRLQEPVPSGNLAAIRGKNSDSSAHERHPARIPQPSLWDAENC